MCERTTLNNKQKFARGGIIPGYGYIDKAPAMGLIQSCTESTVRKDRIPKNLPQLLELLNNMDKL